VKDGRGVVPNQPSVEGYWSTYPELVYPGGGGVKSRYLVSQRTTGREVVSRGHRSGCLPAPFTPDPAAAGQVATPRRAAHAPESWPRPPAAWSASSTVRPADDVDRSTKLHQYLGQSGGWCTLVDLGTRALRDVCRFVPSLGRVLMPRAGPISRAVSVAWEPVTPGRHRRFVAARYPSVTCRCEGSVSLFP
jgi:hypothetical protein